MGILRANKLGVKVISLAALNKNEALNGGGTLFVNKHPDLKVRVVHGNTLTAAVILNEIPKDVKEVFLTGATSKLGRAIALYLCRKKIRVMMLTLSSERFQKIQKEAPTEYQQYLFQVTTYEAAQNCNTWIVGKWMTRKEQYWAPSGTHFHQFVVPPIHGFRRDCTYGNLAAMRLPEDVQGLNICEEYNKAHFSSSKEDASKLSDSPFHVLKVSFSEVGFSKYISITDSHSISSFVFTPVIIFIFLGSTKAVTSVAYETWRLIFLKLFQKFD